ncbi:MAG TPA: hemolysin III family protein [Cyclobacteriaceae bacterium]|nr:hemolysin III family protein [Cyclobacteriaceae bacterium]
MTGEFSNYSRLQTVGEEIANAISHGIGVLAAIAVTPFLIIKAIPLGGGAITGAAIFGASMIILYASSAIYHSLPQCKAKTIFRLLDHAAIFLLIAGTYTPFTLSVLQGAWGWTLFGLIWGLAVVGIILKTVRMHGNSKLSIGLYLAMGWLAVFAVRPLYYSMPTWGLIWILAGGVMYSGGVLFFAYDHRMKFNHFIWHLFVLAGTACHVIAVFQYAFAINHLR